ncbi:MAG: dTDP-4-dehydrorhamnose reductase, partial [Gemmatimonadetes bacterium]
MKVLITGAGGMLGRAVVWAAARDPEAPAVVPLDRAALDVTDRAAVEAALEREAPDAVIHCAAYTAVDRAEDEPERAAAVNVEGARHVAVAAAHRGAALLHVSTDYVFDGRARRPYRPSDPPAPLGVYGRTKAEGEAAVRDAVREGGGRALIVRTGWLYGPGGRNFVDTVLARARAGETLRVVDDQRGGPTWTRSLGPALLELVRRAAPAPGEATVLHLADRGEASWYELACAALTLAGVDAAVEPVGSDTWAAPAPRPAYAVLDIG